MPSAPMPHSDRVRAMHLHELATLLAHVGKSEHLLVTSPPALIMDVANLVARATDGILAEPEASDSVVPTQIAALSEATRTNKCVVLPYLDVTLGSARDAETSLEVWLRSPRNHGVPLVAISACRLPPHITGLFDREIHATRTPVCEALTEAEKRRLAGGDPTRLEDLTFGVDAASLTRALHMAWGEPPDQRVAALERALGAGFTELGRLGGMSETIARLRARRASALRRETGLRLLIRGAHGSGKSTLALALARTLGRVVSLSTSDLLAHDGMFAPDNALVRALETTLDGDVVLLDDLDVTIRRAHEYSGIGGLRTALGAARYRRVHVIATTTNLLGLDPGLKGHFDVVEMPSHGRAARADILTRRLAEGRVTIDDALVELAAELTDGFADEVSGERFGARRLERIATGLADLVASGVPVTADAVRALVEAERTIGHDPVPWELVGGLHEVKSILDEEVIRPRAALRDRPELARRLTIRGILFNGPPGTGKTFLARALGQVLGLPTVAIRASDLLAQYVGQTEEAIRTLFANLRALDGAVLFLDEIDSLLPHRGRSVMGYERPVVNAMLSELDGIKGHTGGLIVIGATNRKDDIDEAALRDGRLELHLRFQPPTPGEAVDILERCAEHVSLPLDQALSELIVDRLWKRDGGTTPARLHHMCVAGARRMLWDPTWRPTLSAMLALR